MLFARGMDDSDAANNLNGFAMCIDIFGLCGFG